MTLVQDGGTLAPGDPIGTTAIAGDYDFNAGLLEIEIDPTRLEQRAEEMEFMLQKLIDGDRISQDDELRYFV